ncbi:hypothetical protein NP233_g7744 [Leucocoprinus birnbaumii]|uniref:DUF6534 domain-containing protein n=1 Tax=Leucocoprinus birnbaumii TaxID=56174 RepID=A0AAD5YPN6_9AGAR|nr:hypothetical protein NP233_g7744 [Leucocoprinus birnbaumii]
MGPAEVAHGPMLLGVVFNVLLYGIMITQIYLYYTTYKRDRAWMKLLVLAVFVADTINTLFDIWYLYESVITHFDDPAFLVKANWRFATDPATTGVIELMVQLFFCWRIWALTKNIFMIAAVGLLSIGGGICALLTTYEITQIPEFVRFQEFKSVVIIWLVCASTADILITSILVWYLSSDLMVDRIIRVTMQTGLLTSLLATLDLIVYLANPTGLHLMLNFPLCKLYSNSLISSLNSRGGWRYDNSNNSVNRTLTDRQGAASSAFDEVRSGWKDEKDLASPRSPTKASSFRSLQSRQEP